MMQWAPDIVAAILMAATLFLFVIGIGGLVALFRGADALRRLKRAATADFSALLMKSPLVPGVSVVVAARDATPEARGLVRRLLDLHYGRHEVVVALDGPSEAARDRWIEEFRLVREGRGTREDLHTQAVRAFYVSRDPLKLLVVEKEPGGEADTYNAAIDAAQYPILGLVDPEAEFVPGWLLRMIRPMLEKWDQTAAVCAVTMPPPVHTLAGRIGALETLRRWLVRGAAFSEGHKLVPIPGACILAKRDAVVAAGGFERGVMELFLALHERKQGIAFVPEPVSWNRPAATIADVRHQVAYDQAQLAAGLRHGGSEAGPAFNGLFCSRVIRPLVETVALVLAGVGFAIGWVHPAVAGLVVLAGAGMGIVVSMTAVVLREMASPESREPQYLLKLFATAIPENLGYRQVRNLWLISGFFGKHD